MHNHRIYPWQMKQWELVWDAKAHNRLPHAMLFVGARGLGKMGFAKELSASLLCEKPALAGSSCGACHSCLLISANSHPDLNIVVPDENKQNIKIDQVRSLINSSNETAMQGGYKVTIINPAQAMNQYAANALLKTLEEPMPQTLFILIAEQSLRLPLTIKSRCQTIAFHKPERKAAMDWLKQQLPKSEIDLQLLLNLSEGAPLRGLALVESNILTMRQEVYTGLTELSEEKVSPLQLAEKWQEYDRVIIFDLLLNGLRDLLRIRLTDRKATLVNEDYRTILINLMQKISLKNLLRYLSLLQERYTAILSLQNMNHQLLLEEVLIHWKGLHTGGAYVPC